MFVSESPVPVTRSHHSEIPPGCETPSRFRKLVTRWIVRRSEFAVLCDDIRVPNEYTRHRCRSRSTHDTLLTCFSSLSVKQFVLITSFQIGGYHTVRALGEQPEMICENE